MQASRLVSLDVFRGLTVALMIIVNSPGNSQSFALLEHAAWNGCTLADWVFPFFILIAGASSVLTLSRAWQRGATTSALIYKISKRTAMLFAIGLLLNGFPHFDVATWRIMGVLQRIALCYFCASLLFLLTSKQTQVLLMLILLLGYWLLMMFFPVPGYGQGNLTLAGNVANFVDQRIIPLTHLYHQTFDPEGILTTLPAIATALLGNCLGYVLLSGRTKRAITNYLSGIGILLLTLGWLWSFSFPINKALWTSSYVLWTGGLAYLFFAACYWLLEIHHSRSWTRPFELFGLSALLVFILHVFFLKVQALILLPADDGTLINLRLYLTTRLFSWAAPRFASLLYALTYLLLWLAVSARQQAKLNRFDKHGMPQLDH